MKKFFGKVKTFLRTNRGAVLAEYSVLLFVIAVALIVGLGAMRNAIHNVINNTTTQLGGTPQ